MNLKALSNLFGFRGASETESDEAFVGRAYDAHADFVFRTLQRFGVREADLPDLTQEVYMVVLKRRHTFDPAGKMTTWLYGIAMRIAAAHRRRAWVRREQPVSEAPDTASDDSPESALIQARAERMLLEVLDTLDIEPRAIFIMFEIEGMSAPEIADVVGVPVGTVHSRLHYARKRFQVAAEHRRVRDARGAS